MGNRPSKLWPREPTMATASSLGERVRAAYNAKGLNRSQFARSLGVPNSTVETWERNEITTMSAALLEKASVILGVSPSWLRGEDRVLTEPQFEEWRAFLGTPAGKSMTKEERSELASMKFDPKRKISVELFHGLLLALRMAQAS